MAGKVLTATDDNFEDMVKEHPLILVDFWAAWCFPCKMVAPTIEELANEFEGKVTFAKLNVDENPKTAMRFGITSIPTLILFKNGEVVEKVIGAVPKEHLAEKIKAHL
ncbi:MAG: thioredoxin [Euryarchaeota archaeon]|nr:thioredoxin [Euryarchaeota archaeon]